VVLPSLLRDVYYEMEGDGPLYLFDLDHEGGSIEIYPLSTWKRMLEDMREEAKRQKKPRLLTFFSGKAKPVDLPRGGNGRLQLPAEMAERFRPGNEILFVGVDTKIEMWIPETYVEVESNFEQDLKETYEMIRY